MFCCGPTVDCSSFCKVSPTHCKLTLNELVGQNGMFKKKKKKKGKWVIKLRIKH